MIKCENTVSDDNASNPTQALLTQMISPEFC